VTRMALLFGLLAVIALPACTIRYSQSLAGAIPEPTGSEVRSSDAGFSLFQIALSEPTHAHEQVKSLMGACSRLTNVEVDYRELSFAILGIPRVTVTGYCER